MATYFFDKEQRLMKIVPDSLTISNQQTQELVDGLLNDYLNATIQNDETLLDSEYMAVKAHEGNSQTFDMYRITNIQTSDDTTTFTGIQLAYYELAGYVVEDIRPVNRSVSYVAGLILNGAEWRVGYVEGNLPNITDNFYYLSAKDSFTKLQEIGNCEVVFKVEISGQGVTDKWVEIYSKLGDRTLKRFNYGSNALTVEREIGKNDIYTALIGRGKGEEVGDGYGRKLSFEDIVWTTASGKPVNKPKGQKYVEIPQATAEYGIKTSSGKVPRIGIVEFNEIEDAGKLLQATYNSLVGVARPKVQFKSTVINIGATNIGDTVTIHRHDLDIHYETRVYKVIRDKLDDNFTEVTLGDAINQSSTRKQARFNSSINNLLTSQNELAVQVNYVSQTADGKNNINYGNNEPEQKRTGDLWFRDHPSLAGEKQMLIWDGNNWIIESDTSDLTKVQRDVEQHTDEIATVTQSANDAVAKADQAIADAGFAKTDAQSALDTALTATNLVDGVTTTVANVRTDLNGNITAVNQMKSTVDANITTLANHTGKISQVEQNVSGLQLLAADKVSTAQFTVLSNQVSSKVESATYNSKITQLDSAINLRVQAGEVTAAILADKTIKDTRSDNQIPSWYQSNYPKQSVTEFKNRTVMGVPGSSNYVQLTTKIPWGAGISGGIPVQVAESSDGTYRRVSNATATAWLAWEKIIEAGELLSQINVQSNNILIQSGKLYLDAASVVFSGSAFIPNAAITSLTADKINAGTLNAANVNIINLNVSKIVGLNSNFIQSEWNKVNATVRIDGDGVKTTGSNGAQAMLQNGVLYAKTPSGAGLGTVGYALDGNENMFVIDVVKDQSFAIRHQSTTGGSSYDNIIGYYDYLNRITLSRETHIVGELNMNGYDIASVKRVKLDFLDFNSTDTSIAPSGEYLDIAGYSGIRFYLNKFQAFLLSRNRATGANSASMYASLNMQGYTITNSPSVSDERLKINIQKTNSNSLDKLMNIEYVNFNWKEDNRKDFGFIAQQIQNIIPEVMRDVNGDYLGYDQQAYTHIIGHAIQQLNQKVVSIDSVTTATNVIANNAMNKAIQVDDEVQQMKNKISELDKKIKLLESVE